MRFAPWLITAITLLILAGVLWWPSAPPTPQRSLPPPKLKPAPLVAKKKGPVTVPGNYSWKDAPEKELKNLVADVTERRKSSGGFKMEFLAQSGESIIADAYEGRPGEYVFCKLVPTVKTRDDGTNVVEVEVNSFSVTLSGEQRELYSNFDKKHEIEQGSAYTMSDQVDEGGYNLNIWGVQILGNGSLRISASGAFQEKTTSPPSQDDD